MSSTHCWHLYCLLKHGEPELGRAAGTISACLQRGALCGLSLSVPAKFKLIPVETAHVDIYPNDIGKMKMA